MIWVVLASTAMLVVWTGLYGDAVSSRCQPSHASWWRQHAGLFDLIMTGLRIMSPPHPQYQDFTLMDDVPTEEERNAGPMVWNPAPPKEEITSEEARRAYRDWNISACAPRRAPDLEALGFASART